MSATMYFLLLVLSGQVNSPTPKHLIVSELRIGKPSVLSVYSLEATKNGAVSRKRIAQAPPIAHNFGGWVTLRPDPNGRAFAWEGHEGSGRAGGLELWSVNPLKRIARLTTGPLREIRWLYGRPALAVAEMRFNRPPKVTLISTQTGKVLKILEGCVAVTDKPGSTTVLALRTAHSSVTFQPWLTTSPNPDIAKMLLDGNIRPEESEDLQNWRHVSLEEAGNRWVFRGAGPKSLATLLTPWEQRLGFKDHWLIPRYKVYPERKGETSPRVDDVMFGPPGTKNLVYNRWDSLIPAFAVLPDGSFVLTNGMDPKPRPPRSWDDPGYLVLTRVSRQGTQVWRIRRGKGWSSDHCIALWR